MSFTTAVTPYGDGKLIHLRSPTLRVSISTLGATLHSVKVYQFDERRWIEVNMHHASYEEALEDTATYMGATIGRVGNRIENATFTLGNRDYHTPKNNGAHTLHGGGNAFDKKHWGFAMTSVGDAIGVRFSYVSPHMENGFPAELHCGVHYYIQRRAPSTLFTDYDAFIPETSPAPATIVNLHNHAYWNLNGFPSCVPCGDGVAKMSEGENGEKKTKDEEETGSRMPQPEKIYNHILRMPRATTMAITTPNVMATGEVKDVIGGSVFDFCRGKPLGEGIDNKEVLQRDPCGYDHPYLIAGWQRPMPKLLLDAELTSPKTRITMQVYSSFPCLFVYTANNFKPDASGRRGERFARHTAVCLEPQQMPDAIHHPNFAQTVVRVGQPYKERMALAFSIAPRPRL